MSALFPMSIVSRVNVRLNFEVYGHWSVAQNNPKGPFFRMDIDLGFLTTIINIKFLAYSWLTCKEKWKITKSLNFVFNAK